MSRQSMTALLCVRRECLAAHGKPLSITAVSASMRASSPPARRRGPGVTPVRRLGEGAVRTSGVGRGDTSAIRLETPRERRRGSRGSEASVVSRFCSFWTLCRLLQSEMGGGAGSTNFVQAALELATQRCTDDPRVMACADWVHLRAAQRGRALPTARLTSECWSRRWSSRLSRAFRYLAVRNASGTYRVVPDSSIGSRPRRWSRTLARAPALSRSRYAP